MKNSGFSLVELSIVLVILGLLTGGILAGQSLIHASQLRAVSTEYNQNTAAIQAFRDKYFALPGDMANATSFWDKAGGTGSDAACSSTASTDAKTCNGNGDGWIASSTGSIEAMRMWQHLANAGLIEGQYDGQGTATSTIPGRNARGSKFDSSAIWSNNPIVTQPIGHAAFFDRSPTGNSLWIGKSGTATWSAVMKPEDAWNIDTKMDDGMPATGRVYAEWSNLFSNSAGKCTNATSSANLAATYNLTNASKDCLPWFLLG